MIRIAICDDEKNILDEVEGYIKNYAEKENYLDIEVFRFDSAKTLISAIEDGKSFDIFVLDVYIGDEMGTTLARDIRKSGIESPIIFATTSLEHAPQSYETGTLRYLIKPIDPGKFYEALDAAIAQAEKVGQRLIKFKTEKINSREPAVEINKVCGGQSGNDKVDKSFFIFAPRLFRAVVKITRKHAEENKNIIEKINNN